MVAPGLLPPPPSPEGVLFPVSQGSGPTACGESQSRPAHMRRGSRSAPAAGS